MSGEFFIYSHNIIFILCDILCESKRSGICYFGVTLVRNGVCFFFTCFSLLPSFSRSTFPPLFLLCLNFSAYLSLSPNTTCPYLSIDWTSHCYWRGPLTPPLWFFVHFWSTNFAQTCFSSIRSCLFHLFSFFLGGGGNDFNIICIDRSCDQIPWNCLATQKKVSIASCFTDSLNKIRNERTGKKNKNTWP